MRLRHHIHAHIKKHHRRYLLGTGLAGTGFFAVKALIFVAGFFGILNHHGTFANFDPSACAGVTEIPVSECEALIDIYNSTDGDNRAGGYNNWWNTTGGICPGQGQYNRFGVDCTSWHVSHLNLSYTHASWNVPWLYLLPYLTWLDLESAHISSIDLSQLTWLHQLYLWLNDLSGVDLSWLVNLTGLGLSRNHLSTIDLSYAPGLKYLSLSHNDFDTIDLSAVTWLQRLQMEDNHLSTIDLSGFTDLWELILSNNNFDTIDLDWLPSLRELTLEHNNLSTLDVSGFDNLELLDIRYNQFSGIDLTGLPHLLYLALWYNQFSTIDVSAHTWLLYLGAEGNDLSGVNLDDFFNLEELDLGRNHIPTIDFSDSTNLDFIYLQNNWMSTINLSWMTKLTKLYLSGNQFTGIDLSWLVMLKRLNMSDNFLTDINLTGNTWLTHLNLANNQLTTIDLSGLVNLVELILWGNHIIMPMLSPGDLINLLTLSVDNNCRDTWSMDQTIIDFFDTKVGNTQWQTELNPQCTFGPPPSPSFDCSTVTDVPQNECEQLVALYSGTDGNNRTTKTNRLDSTWVADWYGITVTDWHVSAINSYNNNLSWAVVISGMTELNQLQMRANTISSVALSNLPNLQQAFFSNNKINYPYLIGLPNLQYLEFEYNELTWIILSGMTSLNDLRLWNNHLSSIDFSEATWLVYLLMRHNELSDIDLSALDHLETLYLEENLFNGIDLHTATGLKTLGLSNNQLTHISLSWLTALISLDAWSNQLSSIDLSQQPDLISLTLSNNTLSGIDLSHNTKLVNLDLGSNDFTTIDISNLTDLERLWLYNNHFVTVDLDELSHLTQLNLSYNHINSLDLSGKNNLTTIDLSENLLSDITLPEMSGLQYLYLAHNLLSGSLAKFCAYTGMLSFRIDYNKFTGDIAPCLMDLVNLDRWSIEYNYLNTDVSDGDLLSFLNNKFGRRWMEQYVDAELLLTGNIITWWNNSFVLNLWYHNNWPQTLGSGTIYYDMIDGMSITSDIAFTTGEVDHVYGGEGDPCFDAMYNENTWWYVALLDTFFAQGEKYDSFLSYLKGELEYTGADNEWWKYFLDLITNREGPIVDRRTFFLEQFELDLADAPWCGIAWRNAYIFDLGSLPAWSGGSIIITGSVTPSLGNSGFDNNLILFSPNDLRIDTYTGNNSIIVGYGGENENISQQKYSGWWGPLLTKDVCPAQRDCSTSYYDNLCGKCSLVEKVVQWNPFVSHTDTSTVTPSIVWSLFSAELNAAYTWAYGYSITTMPSIQQANIQWPLTRKDMAKMISNFAINILDQHITWGPICTFTDTKNLPKETQYYILTACGLWLMWYEDDGVTVNPTFDPNGIVDRAQFGTILSRVLYGSEYNWWMPYYQQHLAILKAKWIMTKIDMPKQNEMRGRVMLMMQRAFETEVK